MAYSTKMGLELSGSGSGKPLQVPAGQCLCNIAAGRAANKTSATESTDWSMIRA